MIDINTKWTTLNPNKMLLKDKFNLRKLGIDEFCRLDGSYDFDSCDNCIHTSIRRSTGVPWCLPIGTKPVSYDAICDLHSPRTRTMMILWDLCHWHWVEWEERWFSNQVKDK